MRLLLLTGKGGVGKTTLAAATGAASADRGSTTLVVSTDPAHSLADAFAVPMGHEPAEVADGLYGAQLDVRALADGAWDGVREQLRAALVRGGGLDGLAAEELSVVPGVDELLALGEVQRLAGTGRWDAVVVDCGPTAETLRLLALPDAVSGYLTRMAGPVAKRSALARSMTRLADHTGALRDLLADPARTSVRLVFTPERVVVAETRRTLTSLALHGIRVDGMIANRVVPSPGWWRGAAAAWVRRRRGQQEAVLSELADSGVGDAARRLRSVEHRAEEPIGLAALREIATELYGTADPLADDLADDAAAAAGGPAGAAGLTPLLQMFEADDGYRLRVAVPLARDSDVDLARVGDDLAITVDGVRRLIALPEPLRACRITDAESDSRGVLVHLEGTE
ncbi:ArsA family ATPase [Prauserella halophila]|uniref:ArsA family ATPase n=1 Tax=Prauserella halophila TaxID=185641 RepID=A0ABN1VW88_9PSEU|nr:ArsA family ATPase [Prauserella halophila]MCP2234368.1 arsenite-transporting ATPase [Prauserella halophila]